jgi:3-hydroxyisobutyrate dehydrogenase-like beta-hydroxyacid dehydrogenase
MAITDTRAATDTRHRVPYPNSRPRRVAVIGLGERGRAIAAGVSTANLAHVTVVPAPGGMAADAGSPGDMLRSIADGADGLARALQDADMIFVVVGAADDASYAPTLARLARHRNILLTGVIIDDPSGAPERDLDVMRRACDMLVITADADYLNGMLQALGV